MSEDAGRLALEQPPPEQLLSGDGETERDHEGQRQRHVFLLVVDLARCAAKRRGPHRDGQEASCRREQGHARDEPPRDGQGERHLGRQHNAIRDERRDPACGERRHAARPDRERAHRVQTPRPDLGEPAQRHQQVDHGRNRTFAAISAAKAQTTAR